MELVYTLSGGAAYGYAHVGVLRLLEEWGLRPRAVVGTSMGAIVGGLYAYGYDSKQIQQVAEQIRSIEIVKLFFPSFPRGGIIDTDGIHDFFYGFIQDALIEELPITYRSVAVDINTGQQVVFDRGRLIDAMMASMSIPTVFKPYGFQGHQLIDGGVLNNLPWKIAREFGRLHVVVDVAPKRREDVRRVMHASELIETEAKDEAERQVEKEHQKQIKQAKEKEVSEQALSENQKSAFRKLEDRLTNGAFRIHLQKLVDTFQARETFAMKDLIKSFTRRSDYKEAALSLPEVITNVMAIINEQQTAEPEGGFLNTYAYIHPELKEYYLNDFNKADEIIEQGYNEALTNPQFIKQVRKIAKKAGSRR